MRYRFQDRIHMLCHIHCVVVSFMMLCDIYHFYLHLSLSACLSLSLCLCLSVSSTPPPFSLTLNAKKFIFLLKLRSWCSEVYVPLYVNTREESMSVLCAESLRERG